MNRQTLADATSLHDAAVPIYLMQEIANGTKASERDAEKTVDFLLGRLAKTNLIVKLKVLQIIAFCIREGDPVFTEIMREEESEISAYIQFSGPPDPVMGDERYRRIRVACQEVLVCLNDGCLPRRNDAPPPANGGGGGPWGAPSHQQAPPPPPPPPQYGGAQPNAYGQQGGYGASNGSDGQSSGPWGNNSSRDSRPAPYSDSPSGPSYGGPGGYGGPQHGNDQHNTGYGGGGYGHEANQQQHQQHQHQSHQPSGLSSWSNPAPSVPSYGAPKAAPGGMWSSSGYQKAAPPPPNYSSGGPSRDNRPTVLVGHNLNFPKPESHGNSGLIGGVSGTSGGAYGGPSGGYGGPSGGGSGYGGQNTGAFGGNSGGFGGNSGGFGGNTGGFGGNSGGFGGNSGGFGGHASRQTPSYIDNMNRMLSNPSGGMGLSGGGGGMHGSASPGPSTKIGKAVVGLKKIGVEAKDRWDRRNMDKSIGASLADHDELNAGPTVMDRGYYQPQSQQVTGGKDTSGEYERGLIDSLCASVGLARAPPADALKRFVDLAQTLDHQTIGDILLDKLEDAVWQVRLKALHVVLALLESPGAAPYMEIFEDNAGVLEELREDAKPTVAQKALQVMRVLGLADESTPEPVKRPAARSTPTRSAPAAPSGGGGGGGEVDFLGFDSLSINAPPQHAPVAPNIYNSPPPSARQAPVPPQEVSLLDGFDPVPQPYHQQPPQQQQQQHQQQQPQQQQQYGDLLLQSPQRQAPAGDRSTMLSNFGKDLFTIANSPRSSGNNPGNGDAPTAERSAFNFM